GEVLATMQDCPLTLQQERSLAKLCLMPLESQQPAPDGDNAGEAHQPPVTVRHPAQTGTTLLFLLDTVNYPDAVKSPLTPRSNLVLEEAATWASQGKKSAAAYSAPSLGLCLQLRGLLTVNDIKRSAAPALLDKLTRLWEILLPLGIDLGAMKDF